MHTNPDIFLKDFHNRVYEYGHLWACETKWREKLGSK